MNPLREAQGFMTLELWDDAWAALDQLPEGTVATPEMVRIRMRAAAGMERWDFVEELASILRHGNEEDRMEAACAYQSLAAEHYRRGRLEEARAMISAAVETRPEQSILIRTDPRFPRRFVEEGNDDFCTPH